MKRLYTSLVLIICAATPLYGDMFGNKANGFKPITYASMIALSVPAGSAFYCSDCNPVAPCTSGGTGAVATYAASRWNCSYGALVAPDGGGVKFFSQDGYNIIGYTGGTGPFFFDATAGATYTFNLQGGGVSNTVFFPPGTTAVPAANQAFTFTGSGPITVTFPGSNTSLPVATQTLTFSGPTAARTITIPDANFTVARTDAANTFTGNQTFSGTMASYNGISTAGFGLSPIVASFSIVTQTASVGTSNILASAPAGQYRVCWTQTITTAATTSSSLLTTIGWNNGSAKTSTLASLNGGALQTTADASNTLNSTMSNCIVLSSAASQNITYATTYASSGATAMQYSLRVTLERLQ